MHYIITALGCKVNQYEAQAIETLLHAHGFTAAADGEPVDLIVVNTCAVTAEGGRKSRQMIRKLREEHPQALCAVCGCWSQLSPEDAAAIGADVVHGSGSKQAFVDDILRAFREHTPVTCVDNPFRRFDFEPLPAGAVISAEPGIYLPGKLGVRIEDVIVITEQGCQNITLAPKELLIL